MAKRFTDTNKYKKAFMRTLPGAYKLFWDFLYHDCDHSGVWIIDFDIAQTYIGKDMPITKEKALELFNSDEERIIQLPGGKKWFIPSFIEFQYGHLSEKNKAHNSIISHLKKLNLIDESLNIIKTLIPPSSPLQGAKEMDKEKEVEKEKDFGKSENLLIPLMVQVFMEAYPDYPKDQEHDFPACVWIAKKIAKYKGWQVGSVVNGRMDETIDYWKEMVRFSKTDSWYSGRSIADFNKEFQRLIQKMTTNGSAAYQQVPVGGTKRGTSDARIDALKNW